MKFLTVLFLGCMGLSGCVLVDDEFATYSSYPSGSYEAAVDYYHRPPKHYMSNHKRKTTVHKKDHHLDKPKHIEKPEPPKHIDKPQSPVVTSNHPIKEKAPKISHQPAPKHDTVKRPEPRPLQESLHKEKMPEKPEHSIKENVPNVSLHHEPKQDVVKKPEPKQPLKETLHKENIQAHSNSKKEKLQKLRSTVHRHR